MFDKNKVYLGIAPIAWTNDDLPDLGAENTFEQCISEMALAGYKGCEVGNKYPTNPEELKEALDLRGLTICNRWFSSFLISKPFEETAEDFRKELKFLSFMGAKVIGVSEQSYSIQGQDKSIFDEKYSMNESEWKLFCEGINKLGAIAKEYGMSLTFHHHMGTVVQTEEEIDQMMANTDPNLVHLLYDTGHLEYCGIDALSILKKHIKRIKHVHLKDIRKEEVAKIKAQKGSFLEGVRNGTFTVPGDGSIDFEPLFAVLEKSGYQGWFVVEAEQDPAKANAFLYALKAREFIKKKTGL